jgi:PIN domain nuclease of toxin-antitoxin system
MTSVLANTQATIWYLLDQTTLSPAALQALSAAERTGRLFVSIITLVEVRLEVEAGRLPQGAWDRVQQAVADPRRTLTVLPVDAIVVDALGQVSPTEYPGMAGQIIAATAVAHELSVVSDSC